MKLFLKDCKFLGITLWHFSSPNFISIKTAVERYNSTTHILLRKWSTFNQVNKQIGIAVQNPFSNVKCSTFILKTLNRNRQLKRTTFTQLINFDYTQGDAYIALTGKGHLGHLQFTTVQFCFVSILGHRKQTKNNQHWQYILSKSGIDIYHNAKFWFYL